MPKTKPTTHIPNSYLEDGIVRAKLVTGVTPPPRKTIREKPTTRRSMFRKLWDAYEALPIATQINEDNMPKDPNMILVAEYDLPMIAARAWQSLYNRYKTSTEFDIAGYVSASGLSVVAWKVAEGSVQRQKPNN